MPKAKPKTKRTKLQPGEQVVRILTGLLDPSSTNRPNRSGFDSKSIAELADSIRVPGIIEPLVVRAKADGQSCTSATSPSRTESISCNR